MTYIDLDDYNEITPAISRLSNEYLGDKVKISFPLLQKKILQLNMAIGKDVARKVGFRKGDKVSIYISKHKPNMWLVKKTGSEKGYTLTEIPGDTLKIQLTWKEGVPKGYDNHRRFVKWDLREGMLELELKEPKDKRDVHEDD